MFLTPYDLLYSSLYSNREDNFEFLWAFWDILSNFFLIYKNKTKRTQRMKKKLNLIYVGMKWYQDKILYIIFLFQRPYLLTVLLYCNRICDDMINSYISEHTEIRRYLGNIYQSNCFQNIQPDNLWIILYIYYILYYTYIFHNMNSWNSVNVISFFFWVLAKRAFFKITFTIASILDCTVTALFIRIAISSIK